MLPALYQSIMSTCRPSIAPRHQLHNRSELKNLYTRILKTNQESPLYLLRPNGMKEAYLVKMKDNALRMSAFLSDLDGTPESPSPFAYQTAYSEDRSSAEAEVITEDPSKLPAPFRMTVHSLATAQRNISNALPSKKLDLPVGVYRYRAAVGDGSFDFSLQILPEDTHQSIMGRMADSIDHENIGVRTAIISGDGYSHMVLRSVDTGEAFPVLFSFEDVESPPEAEGITAFFGLNQVDHYSSSASFSIDGTERTSQENEFTLNRALRIRLLSPSEDSFLIGFEKHAAKISETVADYIGFYNRIIDEDSDYDASMPQAARQNHSERHMLKNEITAITAHHRSELESCGLMLNEDRHLVLQPSLAEQAIQDGDMERLFFAASPYRREIENKLTEVSFNPFKYIDKVIVNYPNPAKAGIQNPYAASFYSGLLFNQYL